MNLNALVLVGICSTEMAKAIIEPSLKLKLQLFPVDEHTLNVLEKLTLSGRKRISSVVEHLNRKWGDSSIAVGEIMLFPFSVKQEDLASSTRWTSKDTIVSAADVYATVGSPTIFRLRYGWFSTAEAGSEGVEVSHTTLCPDNCLLSEDTENVVDLPEPTEVDCVECEDSFPEPLQPSSGEKARAQSSWTNKDVVLIFP
ncbi:hypothetical protein BHE74_00047206 [Ensete ventricosum]|uniref:Uncharacterized protein n=1 Tax=Ensete ventricosum TaxID=4639 RepID=A0A444D6H3_ENSVE|nr:hypothetical protein B296_00045651 [Ensete ventricosum]RWV93701.1 hypothetical protein GW17_00043826 [Ensete ventricosum]RWW46846.1 hypothetical protein BHE74_00047206 [Ensete ventricosum]RZS08743.1 hypothetical protein BHM03_00039766 [Ensete ventricosum]